MPDALHIRPTVASDLPSLAGLYRDAFPDENLLPLVGELLRQARGVLSLVAVQGGAVVGHVAFTICRIEGCPTAAALLGPLAVSPPAQRRGIASALVREGLQRLAQDGIARVLVLGDPRYYTRLGFATETAIEPPYTLPAEWRTAWQSLGLGRDDTDCRGRLAVPPPWRRASLWAPTEA
jgi:putative acetyltransferase